MVDRLRLRLLGPWTYLLELSVEVQTREVLSSPAPIPEDIREAMHVCVKAAPKFRLPGRGPALMLHWWVISARTPTGSIVICCQGSG